MEILKVSLFLIFMLITSPAFSQDYYGYSPKCNKKGEVINWTSGPFISPDYCRDLLDDFCTQTYVNGEQISNRQQEEMSHFFEYDETITAKKINDICNHNKKVLK